MKLDNNDIKLIKHDLKQSLEGLQIQGRVDGRKTKVYSKIGKECADSIVEGLFAQMSAFDKEEGAVER